MAENKIAIVAAIDNIKTPLRFTPTFFLPLTKVANRDLSRIFLMYNDRAQ